MKNFIYLIVLATFTFFGVAHPMSANAEEIDPQKNYVLIYHLGPQDSALQAMRIVPKTLDVQPDFLFYRGKFLVEFRVAGKDFQEIAMFLQEKKNEWSFCDPIKDSWQVGTFLVRWDSVSGNGNLCVVRHDAITMFERLVKISASTNNKELDIFMNGALDFATDNHGLKAK